MEPTVRLEQEDAGAVRFDASVVAHTKLGEKASVVLDRSAFYPESGDEVFEHFSLRWGLQPTIGANSDTYHGNSGSPVYSRRSHEVVGIFTEGEPDVAAPFQAGWRRHEAAIPVTVIVQQLDRLAAAWRKAPGLCRAS